MRAKIGIPESYVARSREEYILLQTFMRDAANDEVIKMLLSEKRETRGLLALQEFAMRADEALKRESEGYGVLDENKIRRVEITLKAGDGGH